MIKTLGKDVNIKTPSLHDYLVNKAIKPVNKLSKMINVYTEEQIFEFTKKESSNIITLSDKNEIITNGYDLF